MDDLTAGFTEDEVRALDMTVAAASNQTLLDGHLFVAWDGRYHFYRDKVNLIKGVGEIW